LAESRDGQRAAREGAPRGSVRPVVRGICSALALASAGLGATSGQEAAGPLPSGRVAAVDTLSRPTLADAQHLFYDARYEAAADLTLVLRRSAGQDLANDELRTSALLFRLKALLETPGDKEGNKKGALKNCAACPGLMKAFFEDVSHGQALARATLRADPDDDVALFYLGKLDLNYVWLQLGPLRRKTGWNEYWEARRSLDAVLKKDPRHVRALVARAWIDYIVDTKMPWGTRWILGGGSRKRALVAVDDADAIESSFYAHTEAEFALWDMRVREHDVVGATEVARRLAGEFPENKEVARFLEAQQKNVRR
jgi:hypothetical protein